VRTNEEAPIELVPYSEEWPARFALEATLLREALGPWLVAGIEHIGSTAVPGLVAKPVIDIMGPVRDLQGACSAIPSVERLGYWYFPYMPTQMAWFCKPSAQFRTHHLHLVPYGSALWRDRLDFRDALRSDADLATQYRELKVGLAAKHRTDREAYTDGKTAFVQAALQAWRTRSGSVA
jgi:GrpB-like predicted nucleotidyltransferase (UPF0157 family)